MPSISYRKNQVLSFTKSAFDFFILRKDKPYILGLVITDVCNLNCIHCRVANVRGSHMSFGEIERHLTKYFAKGARFLYLEGGEPYLWRDGEHTLSDIVALGKRIGYLRVHIYTNGTQPLTATPDVTWVSIDGLPETHHKIRGQSLDGILSNIRSFTKSLALIHTVNTVNCAEVGAFLEFIRERFPRLKVMFFFHTPYYGVDYLLLSPQEKKDTIEDILGYKKSGYPVLNSTAGLRAMASGNFKRPMKISYVVDQAGEYPCCRAFDNPEVCAQCGYSSGVEIDQLRSLRPGAIREALRWY